VRPRGPRGWPARGRNPASPAVTSRGAPGSVVGEQVVGRLARDQPHRQVVAGPLDPDRGGPLTGGDAVEALEAALDEEPEARWSLEIRWDPLRPPRLERLEQLEREASAAS
jgi:hypothetical protein